MISFNRLYDRLKYVSFYRFKMEEIRRKKNVYYYVRKFKIKVRSVLEWIGSFLSNYQ